MDNLSSFIYIIIIAAIIFNGLWGVFRRSKAKEGEILPPFDPRQQPQTAPAREIPEPQEIEIAPVPQPAKRKNKRKAHQPIPSADPPQAKDIQAIAENKEETLFGNPNDLRRAVIYSEILHRKYD